ncbi:MAG: transcriptional regulator, LysR family [Myxococcales bacterium]|nr:transcriptional regulator, LysR family [Myxococcales bacterium]
MINYNHLYYFHVAASEGSVAAAAERLGVTQPTVSEQLRALERTLSVTLFERTSGGIKLTESGRLAFEHTAVMFRAGERLVESFGQGDRDAPRSIRVGIGSSVARSTSSDFLMPLLALEDRIPNIRIGDTAELLRELRDCRLDLVLCESEPPEALRQGLETAMIDKTELVVVAPPSVTPSPDWHDVGLIHYRASSSYRLEVETFLAAHGLRPRIAAEVDDSMFLVEAAARGGYVAIVPRSVARDAILAGRLRILMDVKPTFGEVHALYQDGATAELARRAVEVLIAHARSVRVDEGPLQSPKPRV